MSPPAKAEAPAGDRSPNPADKQLIGAGYTAGMAEVQSPTRTESAGSGGIGTLTRTLPAEISLSMYVNTIPRERPHWWLWTPAAAPQRTLLAQLGWWSP